MSKDFWLKRWQDNIINFHNKDINTILEENFNKIAKPLKRVFVPLCGKSKDMLFFAHKGIEVIGVEFSEIAAKDFFVENNLEFEIKNVNKFKIYQSHQIKIYTGNLFDLTNNELGSIDLVYDRASFIALDPETRQRYAKFMLALSPVVGIFLITKIQANQDHPPYNVDFSEIDNLYRQKFSIQRYEGIALDNNLYLLESR